MYIYNLREGCDADNYCFELTAGGGTLNLDEDGFLESYTAPDTNPTGEANPTITLYCNDEIFDQIELVVNDWCVGDDGLPVTISYTTLQMAINEYQAIFLTNLKAGAPVTEFTFSLAAGDGTLHFDGDGWLTGYTAPADNANCLKNPTIAVTCNDSPLDSISIAINATTTADAYSVKRCNVEWSCNAIEYCAQVKIMTGTCAGVETSYFGQVCGGGNLDPSTDCLWCAGIGRGSCAQVALGAGCGEAGYALDIGFDTRTAPMILAGCCPKALY